LIYLDSSALVKLIHREPETPALITWLGQRPAPSVSSALAPVEVTRALRRTDPAALHRIPLVFGRIILVPLDQPILVTAAGLSDPLLRTLDALHVATALHLATGLEFVTYDARMVKAATNEGLTVSSPA
jgi:predicted nucleic acid-binding protein